ncbi:MAG: endonuclease/exonuclease/phosphatase family protein [Myxococcaceae bacterium]|nr:endonuclease/exonuclease/phosphatase family protein [Myxococcaceae bacterium]
MRALRLVTWNVLHRIHGDKWSGHIVGRFPDERVRTERVAARVAAWLGEGDGAVVCLQEVSGDLLEALRALKGTVFSHRYPRVPSTLKFWKRPLADTSEHLVTLVAGAGRVLHATTFANDKGKGLLSVGLDGGVTLVNTHVSFGRDGVPQLQQVSALLRAPAVLAGDLNAGRDVIAAALAPGVALSQVGSPTCLGSGRHDHGKAIDHVAVAGGELGAVEVLEAEGLSDHHPVRAELRFG